MWTLAALLFPALALPLLLQFAGADHLPSLRVPALWPVELWVIAIAGIVATGAGVLDWRFHRGGLRTVSRPERRAELIALALGALLFVLLAAASAGEPRPALAVPVVAIALTTAGFIVFDETRYHQRCGRYETLLHRLLVGGNTLAFLAWFHWCFVRVGALA